MPAFPKCFVAYPSSLPGKAEAIEKAVEELNTGGTIDAKCWTSLAVSGRPIIGAICEEIRASSLLIADITNLNPNVLFELGYALTQRKRLWLIFNPKVAGAKNLFERFQLLSTIGYTPYANSHDIVNDFYKEAPNSTLEKNLYDDLVRNTSVNTRSGSILYIKPDETTEAVMRLARRVAGAPIPHVIDDPKEIGVQPIEWYVASVTAAQGVICHFLSDNYEDVRISNAKSAFVAGLAFGLNKPLLMLAHQPYRSPIDYRDLMHVHESANQAESFYQVWLSHLLEAEKDKVERRTIQIQAEAAHGGLVNLNIGDPIAEYESEELPEYFVPTAAYADALNGQHSVFVGRKGTGKSATLFKLADELSADPRNHICIIRPIDYELEGLLSLLQKQLSASEKGFLVESLWKTLIYTELAKSVYQRLLEKPSFVSKTQAEVDLMEYVEQNHDLVLAEFSMRLETLVASLANIAYTSSNGIDVKTRISEGVHKVVLNRVRDLLGAVLEKTKTVTILVDNLDKSWTPRTNIQLVSELLFGLLSMSARVSDDFRKSSMGRYKLDLKMMIFIRSDIYASIISYARELDKLPIRKIEWTDPELLIRVIEKRIMVADAALLDAQHVWSTYFVDNVKGVPTKAFLISSVFPRPRDLIYLVRASVQHAVNRGHTKIQESDIISAVDQYSKFVYASLMAEGTPQFRALQDFMTELFGGPSILKEDDIRDALERASLGITNTAFIVELLQDLTFLSYETAPNKFVFEHEKDEKPKLASLARKTVKQVGSKRYQVHPAFHSYLELMSTDSIGQGAFTFV